MCRAVKLSRAGVRAGAGRGAVAVQLHRAGHAGVSRRQAKRAGHADVSLRGNSTKEQELHRVGARGCRAGVRAGVRGCEGRGRAGVRAGALSRRQAKERGCVASSS